MRLDPPVYSLRQKRHIFFSLYILANERVPFMYAPTPAMKLRSRCVPLSEAIGVRAYEISPELANTMGSPSVLPGSADPSTEDPPDVVNDSSDASMQTRMQTSTQTREARGKPEGSPREAQTPTRQREAMVLNPQPRVVLTLIGK